MAVKVFKFFSARRDRLWMDAAAASWVIHLSGKRLKLAKFSRTTTTKKKSKTHTASLAPKEFPTPFNFLGNKPTVELDGSENSRRPALLLVHPRLKFNIPDSPGVCLFICSL